MGDDYALTDYALTVNILDVSSGQFSHSADEFMAGTSRGIYDGVSSLVSRFIAGMGSETERVVQQTGTFSGGAATTYAGSKPQYSYTIVGAVRCNTRDVTLYVVVVDIAIGYTLNDSQAQTEIMARTFELQDFIRDYFSSKYAEDLMPAKEPLLKQELMELMNTRILDTAKSRNIVFNQLSVMEM